MVARHIAARPSQVSRAIHLRWALRKKPSSHANDKLWNAFRHGDGDARRERIFIISGSQMLTSVPSRGWTVSQQIVK